MKHSVISPWRPRQVFLRSRKTRQISEHWTLAAPAQANAILLGHEVFQGQVLHLGAEIIFSAEGRVWRYPANQVELLYWPGLD